jgi:hypothetical protein
MSAVPLVQLLLAAAACFGLWRLCRTQPRIVLAGFLIRALGGQALFWISYLRLPIARSLQLGDGFWFFALDGPAYLRYAEKLVAEGPAAILLLRDQYPSRFFVQVLSLCVAAFGSVASISILLNCAAFLLTCALLLRLGRNDVVLAAVAFGPATILFSLQPLKDAFFMLLMVAIVVTFRRWEELWRTSGSSGARLACAAAILAMTYALAGIRWYVAAIFWIAAAALSVVVILAARRKAWAIVAHVVLLVLFSQAIRTGALDIPTGVARLLNPATMLRTNPKVARTYVVQVRSGFDNTPGATMIAAGNAIAPESTTQPATTPTLKPAPVVETRPGPVAVTRPEPAPEPVAPAPPIPKTVASRLITGFTAMFLPRFVGQTLGLIQVGGGRGMWLFAEIDTIVFDIVVLYAIVHCTRRLRRGARPTATFILCVVAFVLIAGPMIYTISNFGTLFRLRLMLYTLAATIPLTLRDERTDAVQ